MKIISFYIIFDEKKEFLKKLFLFLKKGIFCILLVACSEILIGINLKRYCENSFLQNLKNKVFSTKSGIEETLNLIVYNRSSLKYFLLLPLLQGKYYTVSVLISDKKLNYQLGCR